MLWLVACGGEPIELATATAPTAPIAVAMESGTPACEDCLSAFPATVNGSTRGAASEVDAYDCAPQSNESGPEQHHTLHLDEPGLLWVSLDTVETGADVDVHLLDGQPDAACLDRGNTEAMAFVGAGERTIAIDTWMDRSGRDRSGEYTASVRFIGVSDYESAGLSASVFERALQAYATARHKGETTRSELSIVDFAKLSEHKRFWTVDLATGELLYSMYTTHGEATADPDDFRRALTFSNTSGSHQSSLGLMRTGEDYYGMWGHSLRLYGLEPHNALARKRLIVLHSHESATQAFVDEYGGAGLSWGCLMLDPASIDEVIATLEEGTLIWSDLAGDEQITSSQYLPTTAASTLDE